METLQTALFPDDGQNVYAVVDGASCEGLLDKLDEWRPEFVCLYAGELEPDVEEVAPYLVQLLPEHPFTAWLLDHCLGRYWTIFARSPANLRALRRHFRGFLLCRAPGGKTLYFRFYDPRVLPVYLPMTNRKELQSFFGEVSSYLCEADGEQFAAFQTEAGELVRRDLFPLAAKEPSAA